MLLCARLQLLWKQLDNNYKIYRYSNIRRTLTSVEISTLSVDPFAPGGPLKVKLLV